MKSVALEYDRERGYTGTHYVLRLLSRNRIRSVFVSFYNMDRSD